MDRDTPAISASDPPASELLVPASTRRGSRFLARSAPVVGCYALAAILSLVLAVALLRLWRGDLHVPLVYDRDALLEAAGIKGLLEQGWCGHNPRLAAPEGQSLEDFPPVDFVNCLIAKLLGMASGDAGTTFNLFVLSGFVLTTISSLAVLRQFGVAYPPALACSLLYSLAPYHFARLEGGHIFLACYQVVPYSLLVAMWIYLGKLPLSFRRAPGETGHPGRRWAVALLIAVAQGGAGIYYAFFAEYFLLCAGVVASLRRWKPQPLFTAGALIVLTGATVAAQLAPSILYWRQHGKNPAVATREVRETEWYAVKLTPMLLPIAGHRAGALAALRERYQAQMLHHYEVNTATLGCVASVGFLVLLGVLCCRRRVSPIMEGLSLLSVLGFVCGTSGGLGMLFSLIVSPQMRSQNRICVYLAFLAMAAVALLLQAAWTRIATAPGRRALFCGGLAGLVWFGLWDQHPRSSRPDYADLRHRWNQDAEFVAEIEASLPPGAMVFQLPCAKFPEGPGIHQHHSYYAMRFYLHSKCLRWSSGAVVGRAGAQWQEQVSALPLDVQLRAIAAAGFQAVQVSRLGYPDRGAALEAQLGGLLDSTPILNRNGLDCCYRLDRLEAPAVEIARRPQPNARD